VIHSLYPMSSGWRNLIDGICKSRIILVPQPLAEVYLGDCENDNKMLKSNVGRYLWFKKTLISSGNVASNTKTISE
jgi:hypothetical protein